MFENLFRGLFRNLSLSCQTARGPFSSPRAGDFLCSVHSDGEDDCEQDADPAGDEAGVHDGDDTDLNGLCLSFCKTKSNRDEIAGCVAVQSEQADQCQGRGDPSGCDLGTHDTAQDLGDDGAGSQDGGQSGDGADDTQDQESGDGAEQGLQDAGEEGAEARAGRRCRSPCR